MLALKSRQYGCFNFCTEIKGTACIKYCTVLHRNRGVLLHRNRGVRLTFIAVRSAFIWHRNRGCTAAVNAGHDFQDFEIKSLVEISCIFTVLLF